MGEYCFRIALAHEDQRPTGLPCLGCLFYSICSYTKISNSIWDLYLINLICCTLKRKMCSTTRLVVNSDMKWRLTSGSVPLHYAEVGDIQQGLGLPGKASL